MRFIGFVLTMVVAEALVGHASVAWYVIGVIAFLVFRPFGGGSPKPDRETSSLERSPDTIAAGTYPPEIDRPALSSVDMRTTSFRWGKVLLATLFAIVLLVGLATLFRSGDDTPPANETAKVAVQEDDDDHVAGKVWNSERCETTNFPQIGNPQVAEKFGAMTQQAGWRLRIAQARAFCGHEWDAKRFAAAADLLESNHMLMPQWSSENKIAQQKAAEMFGVENPSMYAAFTPEIANFFKVMDAGILLAGTDDMVDELRVKDPAIPPTNIIRAIRTELKLDSDYTRSGALPQIYVISKSSPRVRLVTDLGIGGTLREVIWQAVSVTYDKNVADAEDFASIVGGTMTSHGNMLAGIPLMVMSLNIRNSAADRERFAKRTQRTVPPLRDLDIYFLRSFPERIEKLLNERVARYDPDASAMYVSRREHADFVVDSLKLGVWKASDAVLPSALWHELDHYLYDPMNADGSGFMIEGVATALGEHERRTLEAGLAVPRGDPLFAEKKSLQTALQDGSLTQKQVEQWAANAEDRIRRHRMTDVECEFITLASSEYLAKNRPMPIAQMLTLTPRMFQSSDYGDVWLNYATAWTVLHFVLVEERAAQDDFWPAALRAASSEPLTDDDRKHLAQLSDRALIWLRAAQERRSTLCPDDKAGTARSAGTT